MRVEVEETGFLMARVYLLFDEESPEPEDTAVQEYLQSHHLRPKRILRVGRDNGRYQVLQYGICYLSPHWDAILALIKEAGTREVQGARRAQEFFNRPRRWEVS